MKTIIAKLAIREFWMFTIAGVGMLAVGVMGILAIVHGVPKSSDTLLGIIATGILLRIGDVINAIRALWRVSQEHIEAEPGEK